MCNLSNDASKPELDPADVAKQDMTDIEQIDDKDDIEDKDDKELDIVIDQETDKEFKELERQRKANKRIYSVEGYADNENMWEKLLNVEKTVNCPASKTDLSNNKHQF